MKAKVLYHILGLTAAFCLIFATLITSVEAVVYWNEHYFEKEFRKYQVAERVRMDPKDLLTVTDEMMDYLRGDRDDLVVQTTVDGEEREFFNEREKLHMADVRGLFLSAMALRLGAGILTFLLWAVLLWKKQGLVLLRMLQWGIGLFLGGLAVLAALAATNFTKYFAAFHQLFFENDLWILDPETDLLINILPEGFFRDTAFAVLVLFPGVCLFFWLAAACIRKRAKK